MCITPIDTARNESCFFLSLLVASCSICVDSMWPSGLIIEILWKLWVSFPPCAQRISHLVDQSNPDNLVACYLWKQNTGMKPPIINNFHFFGSRLGLLYCNCHCRSTSGVGGKQYSISNSPTIYQRHQSYNTSYSCQTVGSRYSQPHGSGYMQPQTNSAAALSSATDAVQCPICFNYFLSNMIEAHASDCIIEWHCLQ